MAQRSPLSHNDLEDPEIEASIPPQDDLSSIMAALDLSSLDVHPPMQSNRHHYHVRDRGVMESWFRAAEASQGVPGGRVQAFEAANPAASLGSPPSTAASAESPTSISDQPGLWYSRDRVKYKRFQSQDAALADWRRALRAREVEAISDVAPAEVGLVTVSTGLGLNLAQRRQRVRDCFAAVARRKREAEARCEREAEER
ncbi:hypothetical protein FA95DRAFT_1578823, partial [Auriscalpium vulgare]